MFRHINVEIFRGYWAVNDVKKNPRKLFIFGDNDKRLGKKGQSIIRSEPNSAGIRTKKRPSLDPNAFYSDHEFKENVKKIRYDVKKIINLLEKNYIYDTLVLPQYAIGTGLSKLDKCAPKTFDFLVMKLNELMARYR